MFTHSVRVFRCVHASLYEALSVRRSVGPSVRGSVRRSGVSQISRKWRLWDNKTSGNNKFKLIQLNSSKFKQIQENSFILTYIGRIFVRIELVNSLQTLHGFQNCQNSRKMYQYLVGTSQKHWNALNTWGPSKELNQPKKRWQKCLISGPLGDPTDPVLFMFKTKTIKIVTRYFRETIECITYMENFN